MVNNLENAKKNITALFAIFLNLNLIFYYTQQQLIIILIREQQSLSFNSWGRIIHSWKSSNTLNGQIFQKHTFKGIPNLAAGKLGSC